MKKLVIGILAHVDAGKTTLSEELLYLCGDYDFFQAGAAKNRKYGSDAFGYTGTCGFFS